MSTIQDQAVLASILDFYVRMIWIQRSPKLKDDLVLSQIELRRICLVVLRLVIEKCYFTPKIYGM